MNRQNNLKIILTTVIVLVISAITVFTVVNWGEIVKKFQGAAAKNDGFEKHERNTVQPNNADTAPTTSDSAKDSSNLPDESKILHHPTESNTKSFSKFDEPLNPEVKDIKPIGLDDPPVKAKDSANTFKPKTNEEFPLATDNSLDSNKKIFPPEKSIKMSKGNKHIHAKRHHRKHRHLRKRIVKSNALEKRISFLEKKFGVKKPSGKKQANLANRVYTLEKLISKKK